MTVVLCHMHTIILVKSSQLSLCISPSIQAVIQLRYLHSYNMGQENSIYWMSSSVKHQNTK